MARRINAAGVSLIKSFEGLRLEAYKCPANVWTIGYGSTGPHVRPGMVITEDRAEELLLEDLRRFEHGVEVMVANAPTNDNQFSALVSLGFNIGLGALATSTVMKRHKLGNKLGAANAILMWKRGGGRILPGLVRRREAERRLYLA